MIGEIRVTGPVDLDAGRQKVLDEFDLHESAATLAKRFAPGWAQ